MERKQHLNHPGLEPLWQSLERDWLWQLLALLVLFVLGLLSLAASFVGNLFLLLFGFGATAIGAFFLYRHMLFPSVLDLLLEKLYEKPEEVIWVYSLVNDHHPFGLQFLQRGILYFKLANGDDISANIPPHKLKLVSKILARALPHTVFGYTKERARRYAENPDSLRDNA